MRTINHRFPWTERTSWAWPKDDVKLLQVIDDVNDLDVVMAQFWPRHRPRGACIQAGAATGIWARYLAKEFPRVYAFEPLRENFECALRNLEGCEDVIISQAALGNGQEPNTVSMRQHPNEERNAGSHQVDFSAVGEKVPVTTIDGFLPQGIFVEFIALDLEGYEMSALAGAHNTIRSCEPVIMVEDKGLSEKYGIRKGDVVRWLEKRYGYTVARRIKRDVILTRN